VDNQKPNDALYDKLAAEYDTYVDALTAKSKDEILTNAYEKAWKEEILAAFEMSHYSGSECAVLMKVDNLLDALYREWLDTDSDYLEHLRDCIDTAAEREFKDANLESPEIEEVIETVEAAPPVNIFVPQDYGSPRQTEASAIARGGKLYVGDWVVVHPEEDYGCLIGQVTAIDKLGTEEHDTDNETDDVHVEFIDYGYSEKDEARILAGLRTMRPDLTTLEEFALDDVIMAPESLITLAGDDIELVNAVSEQLYRLRKDANDFLRAYFGDKENVLIERAERNYADYISGLQGFGASELIEMAATIHAYSDAYSYLTTGYHGFSDDELQFYTRFENPLQVVAEAWHTRNIDLDDMSFTLDFLNERKESLLAEYPLIDDIPAEVAEEPAEPEMPEPPAPPHPVKSSQVQPPPDKKPSILDLMAAKKEKVEAYKAQAALNPIKQIKTKNNKERD
jgi:hypothetical protein